MKIKIPSSSYLFTRIQQAIRRFPFTMIWALAGTVLSYVWINEIFEGENHEEFTFLRLIVSAWLGLSLSLALDLTAEKLKWKPAIRILVQILLTGIMVFIWYFNGPPTSFSAFLRYFVTGVFFHLLVAVLPFIKDGNEKGFWEFNKSLFLRFLLSLLYSGALYIGIVAGLFAIKQLLGVPIKESVLLYVFASIAGIFNTAFFLFGIPENLQTMEDRLKYPLGLKIFVQYVLLPLTMLYLIILYAYLGKILITWNIPEGWVSWLVLIFSVSGVLAFLFLHPEAEKEKWISRNRKLFYIALIPLIILMFIAIYIRIDAYGITENRYYVSLLGVWLSTISIYFIFSNKKDIRIIPITLIISGLISVYSPIGASQSSKRNQARRLENAIQQYNKIAEGNDSGTKTEHLDSIIEMASESMFYLVENHGIESVETVFGEKCKTVIDSLKIVENEKGTMSFAMSESLFKCAGIPFRMAVVASPEENEYFNYSYTQEIPYSTGNYSYSYNITLNDYDRRSSKSIGTSTIQEINTDSFGTVKLYYNGEIPELCITEITTTDTIKIPLNDVLIRMKKITDASEQSEVKSLPVGIDFTGEKVKGKVYFTNASGRNKENGKKMLESLSLILFYSLE